jgi:hypothetical protein
MNRRVVAELVGAALVCVGVSYIWIPGGVILGGLAVIWVAQLGTREDGK